MGCKICFPLWGWHHGSSAKPNKMKPVKILISSLSFLQLKWFCFKIWFNFKMPDSSSVEITGRNSPTLVKIYLAFLLRVKWSPLWLHTPPHFLTPHLSLAGLIHLCLLLSIVRKLTDGFLSRQHHLHFAEWGSQLKLKDMVLIMSIKFSLSACING